MNFSLTILGSSSASPTDNRFPSAQMLHIHGRHYLIDCGEGAQLQLQRFAQPILKLEGLFLSHLHGDHLYGIFGLISSLGLKGRTKPLPIFAPMGIRAILDAHLANLGYELSFALDIHELQCEQPTIILNEQSFTVCAFPLFHNVPTCGYLFREKKPMLNIYKAAITQYRLGTRDIVAIKSGANFTLPNGKVVPNKQLTYRAHPARAFAYCSDTMPNPAITQIVQGVDLLYHEATYDEQLRQQAILHAHSTALQAAQTAKDANIKHLVIGHFSARYHDLNVLLREAQQVFPNTTLAYEGINILVGDSPQYTAGIRFSFRNATINDMPRIVEIYNATVASRTATADLQPVTVAERMAWFHAHNPQQHPLVVIKLPDNTIAGWLSLQAFHPRAAYAATQEVSLYIDQPYRRKGLGHAALQHAATLAKSTATKNLTALIFEHNTPSMRLFSQHGYTLWGRLPNIATLDDVERTLCILGMRL